MNNRVKRTLLIIKPDAFKRNIRERILDIFYDANLICIASLQCTLRDDIVSKLYREHVGKSWFDSYKTFMQSNPCFVFVLEGCDAVNKVMKMTGEETDPSLCHPDTIRYQFADSYRCNVIHRSDSLDSANYEISVFFPSIQINELTPI